MTARGSRRWKLWHWSALVLVTALFLGLGRAYAGEMAIPVGLVILSFFIGFWLCLRLSLRAADRAMEWGQKQGGFFGFAVEVAGALMLFAAPIMVVVLGMLAVAAIVGFLL